MALVQIENTVLSDLAVNENDPSVGRARRVVNVTLTDAIELGTLVFRTTASGVLDQAAPYTPATVGDLVAANEFAVVFGDKYACKQTIEPVEDADTLCVAFVGFGIILKDKKVLDVNGIDRDSDEHKALKALLERQGVILAETMENL